MNKLHHSEHAFSFIQLKKKSHYPENNLPCFNFNPLNVTSKVFLQVREKIKSHVFSEELLIIGS